MASKLAFPLFARRPVQAAAWLAATVLAQGAQAQSPAHLVYVPTSNQGFAVIDAATRQASQIGGLAANPRTIVVRGDESMAYAALEGGTIAIIDTSTNSFQTLRVGPQPAINIAVGMALSPDNRRLYVLSVPEDDGDSTLVVVDTQTKTIADSIFIPGADNLAKAVAVTPDGATVYVANSVSGTVVAIDAASATAVATYTVAGAHKLAISPDGRTVYVAGTDGQVTAIDPANQATPTRVAFTVPTLPGGPSADDLALSPDGRRLYVAARDNGVLYVVDTATGVAATSFNLAAVAGVSVSADGATVQATLEGGSAVLIDPVTQSMALVGSVGPTPRSPAVCSNGNVLLQAGNTFMARTGSALLCTGAAGPIFTGGTLQVLGSSIASALPASLQPGGGTVDTNGNAALLSGTISGPGRLTKAGAGTLTLTGTNTYSGGTLIQAGTLVGSSTSLGQGDIQNDAALVFEQAVDGSFSPRIGGSGSVTKTGAGTLTLSGINTYTGGTTLLQGRLIGSAASFGSGPVDNRGALVFDQASNADFAASITGTGHVTKEGAGTLRLTGSNTYQGGTLVRAGTLSASVASLGVGAVINDATLVMLESSDARLGAGISGAGALVKQGPGTLTLAQPSTYRGSTTVVEGVLRADTAGAFATNSAFTVSAGATLALNNLDQTIGSLAGAGRVELGSGRLTLGGNGLDTTFAGTAGGGGGLTKEGTGKTSLTGTNTYGNATFIVGGTLSGSAASFGSGDIVNDAALEFDQAGDATFAGLISGGGGMTKTGSGTLTLGNTNTYRGGTTVSAGTLAGTSTSFGSGAIVNNAALVIQQATDAVFGTPISGTGSLLKRGAGRLDLTGTSTLSGPTTVAAGTLAVNGSLAASIVGVDSGAFIGGIGTVGGLVVRTGATVAPGNSIGTLHVQGDVSFATGSFYDVELDASGASDLIVAGGRVTLQGGTVRAQAQANNFALQTRYTIVAGGAGVSGTFDGATTNFAFLSPRLEYDANNVYLTLEQNGAPLASAATTPNQASTANAIQTAFAAGTPIRDTLVPATAADADAVFDAISGEIHARMATALFADSDIIRRAVLRRLHDVQTRPAMDAPPWAHAVGAWAREGAGGAPTLRTTTGALVLGADKRIGPDAQAGFAAGYSRMSLELRDRLSSAKVASGHASAYAGATRGPWTVRAGAAYSHHAIEGERLIVHSALQQTLRGKTTGSAAQLFGEAGHRLALNDTSSMEPFIGAAAIDLRARGFTESGGDLALRAAAQHLHVSTLTLGVRGEGRIDPTSPWKVRSLLGWRAAMGLTPAAVLAFQNAAVNAPFTLVGVPSARHNLLAEFGIDWQPSANRYFGVSYEAVGGSHVGEHALRARLEWRF